MKWFHNLRISAKLIISFLVVLALTLSLGIFSLAQFTNVHNSGTALTNYAAQGINQAANMRAAALELAAIQLANASGSGSHVIPSSQEDIAKLTKTVRDILSTMRGVSRTEQGRQTIEAMQKNIDDFEKYVQEGFDKVSGMDIGEASIIFMNQATPQVMELARRSASLQEVALNRVASELKADAETYESNRRTIMIVIVACFAAGIGMALYISSLISRSVREATSVAKRVAGGDLSVSFPPQNKDEIGELMTALQDMSSNLSRVVTDIRHGTESINIASSEVASGNMDLSSRTEHQASSLEETASAMEELTSTVKQNAENAQQANMLAINASGIASEGGEVMENVITTMGSINESSRRIVDIITVIDGIAFQTNILALNAAVEAARAGEQGRGFAVVASEVRSLAQRSASAAKEIKELIDSSVDNVESGSKLVEKAGATMSEVVVSIRRVTDIVSEITAASQEQSAGIEQINHSIAQMEQVTQQNAALVEEAASATQSMLQQSNALKEAVAYFNTGATGVSAKTTRKAAPVNITPAPAPIRQKQAPAAPKASPKPALPVAKPKDNEDDWTEF